MKRILPILLLLALSLAACNGTSSTEANANADSLAAKGQPAPQGADIPRPEAKFLCTTISQDDDMYPLVVVKALINGKEYLVDTVHAASPMEAADYPSNQVPENALAAAGGWFAGSGDYFYMLQDGQHVVLMAGWQDEQQEGSDFHYIEKSRYPLQ